jgi:hypothetical protein
MGYTHYWTLSRPITTEECAALAEDVEKIVAKSGVPVAYEYDEPTRPPRLDEREICLNGIGEDGHETFYIKAEKSGITNQPGMAGFAFCKTAAKPYDVIVAASLLALKDHLKADVRVSSDGDLADWEPGFRLASKALGRVVPSPAWTLDS